MADTDDDKDEISLLDLISILWLGKRLILTISILSCVGVVGFSIISLVLPPEKSPLPNQFASTAYMLINDSSSSSSISSMLGSSGLGGLASLAGINVPSSASVSQLALYLMGSNNLLDSVVDEFGLIERWEIEKYIRSESRKMVKECLSASFNDKNGVFSIRFEDIDGEFAQEVVNFCVFYLEKRFNELGIDKNKLEKENLERNIENTYREIQSLEDQSRQLERSVSGYTAPGALPAITLELNRIALELEAQRQVYTQLKVQYELLKVNMASETPVFQILELAEVPDQKSGPSRGMLCIIVAFAGFFFSVFLVFGLNAIKNIRNDPEAMAKLRGQQA